MQGTPPALQSLRRVALLVFGSADEVLPFAELFAELGPPANLDAALDRAASNGLHFRANYSRLLAAWCAVCAIRQPLSAMVLATTMAPTYYALFVQRGVVHVPLPRAADAPAKVATLMWPTLHASLAAGSVGFLLLLGRLGFVLWLLLPPLLLMAVHAVIRAPARRPSDVRRIANELRTALKAELRGEARDEADVEELEHFAGDDTFGAPSPVVRDDAMAQRVNAIRNKYRPNKLRD